MYPEYPSDAAVPTLQPAGPLVDGDQVREDVAGAAGQAPGVRGSGVKKHFRCVSCYNKCSVMSDLLPGGRDLPQCLRSTACASRPGRP